MNNVYDSTIIVDEKGRMNGTTYGGYWERGLTDGERAFNAPVIATDRIIFPVSILPSSGAYTISAWIWINQYAASHDIVFAYGPSNNPCISTRSSLYGNSVWIRNSGSTTVLQTANNTGITLGKWWHWITVWDNTVGDIFTDGTQLSKVVNASIAPGVLPLNQLFYYAGGHAATAMGRMCHLRIYNRALTVNEIFELYHAKT